MYLIRSSFLLRMHKSQEKIEYRLKKSRTVIIALSLKEML